MHPCLYLCRQQLVDEAVPLHWVLAFECRADHINPARGAGDGSGEATADIVPPGTKKHACIPSRALCS